MGAKISKEPEEGEEERLPIYFFMPSCAPGGREERAEVIVNSFGEAEVKRGADTGLRPTEMSQAVRGPGGGPRCSSGYCGTPGGLALCSAPWETLRGALMGTDKQKGVWGEEG